MIILKNSKFLNHRAGRPPSFMTHRERNVPELILKKKIPINNITWLKFCDSITEQYKFPQVRYGLKHRCVEGVYAVVVQVQLQKIGETVIGIVCQVCQIVVSEM